MLNRGPDRRRRGSLAAVHAIEGLRELGFGGVITLVGGELHLPYDRPGLSKEALRNSPDDQALLLREPAWFDEVGVDLLLGVSAAELDVANQQLTLEDGAQLGYDGMVIATGSKPISFASGYGRIHTLRTIDDCRGLHRSLVDATHVAVVGAGFIGLEVAATAREMGLDVSLVEIAPVPLTRVLGDEVGEWFRDHHARHGVTMYTSSALWSVDSGPRGASLTLDADRTIAADVVVAGVGVVPATDWLRSSGLALSGGCSATGRCAPPSAERAHQRQHPVGTWVAVRLLWRVTTLSNPPLCWHRGSACGTGRASRRRLCQWQIWSQRSRVKPPTMTREQDRSWQ